MSEHASSVSLWQKIMNMDQYDARFGALFLSMLIYAVWGSPTPDVLGLPEILIGIFLVIAVSPGRIITLLKNPEQKGWREYARVLFLIGLPLPLIVSLFHGNQLSHIIRDVIPFLFLLLPLFLHDLLSRKPGYKPLLTIAVSGVGLIFALRVLAPLITGGTYYGWSLPQPADPFYLANAPTVLFAGLFFIGMAGFEIYRADTRYAVPYAFLLMFLSFFPLTAMALILQRASMGMVAVTVVCLLCFSFYKKPERALLPFLTVVAVTFLGWDIISDVIDSLAHKTSLVGFNMRFQEAGAVMNELSGSFWTVIFGKGWGATFISPAVGGVTVNFTHNLLTSFWLKTGLIGLVLVFAYLYAISKLLPSMLFRVPVVALALLAPFFIDIFLYASFKSYDFGMILLLMTLWSDEVRRLKKNETYSTK